MGQELREKLLRYAAQARRDGIASLLDETDMPEELDRLVQNLPTGHRW